MGYIVPRMRRALTMLALLLCWQMMPGGGELVEHLVHLATEGHLAHTSCEEAQPREAEHGCSGPYHVCTCHASTPFILTQPEVLASAEGDAVSTSIWSAHLRPATGHPFGVFRPPIV